jgi:tartrate-resistant acid phosphatase type 5
MSHLSRPGRWPCPGTFLLLLLVLGLLCAPLAASAPHPASAAGTAIFLPLVQTPPLRFAVIGDYGVDTQPARDVAALVASWRPDFILTTGDNNYPSGAAETIDRHIGALYHPFIAPYRGSYGPGATVNRFFPSLGNHDWLAGALPYLDYFSLPGNERYYDVEWGPVHIFALDSDPHEPDGVDKASLQARWLQNQLASSTACWNIVYMHHPPFSSGPHGSTPWMQWPYRSWGADVVFAGHDHTYERIYHDGLPYIVNGLGGNMPYPFGTVVPESQVRFNGDVGAMLVEATNEQLTLSFITRTGQMIDRYEIPATCV